MITSNPRSPSGQKKVHSIRCYDDKWNCAMERAEKDGVTISDVLIIWLEAYGEGIVTHDQITGKAVIEEEEEK